MYYRDYVNILMRLDLHPGSLSREDKQAIAATIQQVLNLALASSFDIEHSRKPTAAQAQAELDRLIEEANKQLALRALAIRRDGEVVEVPTLFRSVLALTGSISLINMKDDPDCPGESFPYALWVAPQVGYPKTFQLQDAQDVDAEADKLAFQMQLCGPVFPEGVLKHLSRYFSIENSRADSGTASITRLLKVLLSRFRARSRVDEMHLGQPRIVLDDDWSRGEVKLILPASTKTEGQYFDNIVPIALKDYYKDEINDDDLNTLPPYASSHRESPMFVFEEAKRFAEGVASGLPTQSLQDNLLPFYFSRGESDAESLQTWGIFNEIKWLDKALHLHSNKDLALGLGSVCLTFYSGHLHFNGTVFRFAGTSKEELLRIEGVTLPPEA